MCTFGIGLRAHSNLFPTILASGIHFDIGYSVQNNHYADILIAFISVFVARR